ncbi:MAG TPA: hypothetical protein VOA78_03550 [Candidatus Dormibacteraeota bacterium]|nr:hypothetical protein [Candidatus Dormibacteraeota bacterium]
MSFVAQYEAMAYGEIFPKNCSGDEKAKEHEFFVLAERFRNAAEPEEVKQLGDDLGRMIFGKGDAL